jgi:hypothetical protein
MRADYFPEHMVASAMTLLARTALALRHGMTHQANETSGAPASPAHNPPAAAVLALIAFAACVTIRPLASAAWH